MIKKELFVDCLEKIKAYADKENLIYDTSDGLIDFINFNELQEMVTAFINLLAYCVHATELPYCGTDIDYFIYEMKWGADFENYHISNADGTAIPMHNIEELWDYFVSLDPNIVDKEE